MDIRETAREAIISAGGFVAEAFERNLDFDFQQKDRNDFVTDADRKSEQIIKDILSASFPGITFLAEESAERIEAGTFWIVDPLDGTTNFIHRYPAVGLSIALFDKGKVVFGMVLDPLKGELYEAERGAGALCNERRISVSGIEDMRIALIGTGFPFSVHDYLEDYLQVFRDVFLAASGVRRAGAATLDLCHLAAGRLDGFWELYLKPWDMAAGALIVEEAGGKVSDFFGRPDYLNAGNIVAGNKVIYSRILAITEKFFNSAELESIANNLIVSLRG